MVTELTARQQRAEAKAKAKQMPKAAAPVLPKAVPQPAVLPPWRQHPAVPPGPAAAPGPAQAPVQAEPGPVQAEPGPLAAEPGPVQAEPGPVQAEVGPVQAEVGPVQAEPGPVQAEPGPVAPAEVLVEEGSAWERRVLGRNLRRALEPVERAASDTSVETQTPSYQAFSEGDAVAAVGQEAAGSSTDPPLPSDPLEAAVALEAASSTDLPLPLDPLDPGLGTETEVPPRPCSTPTLTGSPTSVASSEAAIGVAPDWLVEESGMILAGRAQKLFANSANLSGCTGFGFVSFFACFYFIRGRLP